MMSSKLARSTGLSCYLKHKRLAEQKNLRWRQFGTAQSRPLVGWELDDASNVGTITLRSPETYNALTVEMGREFSALCREIAHDATNTTTQGSSNNNISAVVLTGQGDDAFSAGGNLDWLRNLRNNSVHENSDIMLNFYRSFLCVRQIPVPVVAAMPGPAVGAGAGLALACDLRTAAPKQAILGFNFTKLGIHTGMGASHLLAKALGERSGVVNEILLTGKVLSGQECLDLGLVNRLSDQPRRAAYDLAQELSSRQHPVAVRLLLQTLRTRQDRGLDEALQREALAQAACYNRRDWGEGVDAVAEKRSPVFDVYHAK